MVDKGFIKPSLPTLGASVLFVKKNDQNLRMSIDYSELSKVTINNKYPSPKIVDFQIFTRGIGIFLGRPYTKVSLLED